MEVLPLRLRRKRKTLQADSTDRSEFPFAELQIIQPLLINAHPLDAVVTLSPRLRLRIGDDWEVSYKKRFRANIIVWGMPRDLTTLKIRAKFADLGLVSFVRGKVFWEGEHVRLVLTPRDSRGLTKELVG